MEATKERPAQCEQAFLLLVWLLFEFDRCGRFAGAVIRTRLTPLTSLTMRLVVFCRTSHGSWALSAVMKSLVMTARRGDGVVVGARPSPMTPTLRMFKPARQYWPRPSAALATYLRGRWHHSWTILTFSAVTSPMMRGCRDRAPERLAAHDYSGRPSSRPAARTSSLKSGRSLTRRSL